MSQLIVDELRNVANTRTVETEDLLISDVDPYTTYGTIMQVKNTVAMYYSDYLNILDPDPNTMFLLFQDPIAAVVTEDEPEVT